MRRALIFLLFLSLLWISQVRISIGTDQGESGIFGNTQLPQFYTINWDDFWALFNTVSAWDLEYNQGSGWGSIKGDLTVLRNYTEPWLCKIRLIFNASYHADYRLTFLVDRRVQNYTHIENRTRYVISYQNYTLFFSWEDLLGIPGLQFSHGVTEYLGKPCFWFRLRRDNVPQGTYLDLDPSFGYETEGGNTARIEDQIRGSLFNTTESGIADSITAYLGRSGSFNVKAAIYRHNNSSLVGSTEELSIGVGGSWVTLSFSSPKPTLETDTGYILVVWSNYDRDDNCNAYYDPGLENQGHLDTEVYGEFPSTGSFSHNAFKYSIYCTYSQGPPTMGVFESSEDPVSSGQWFSLNTTIQDPDGIADFVNCTLKLDPGPLTLKWDNSSSVFSIYYDPNGYCVINASACIEAQLNNTAYELSWRIYLKTTYPHGTSVDLSASGLYPTQVYDSYGDSSTGSYSELFLFEPEEAGEPGIPTGGARRKTPLEELGIPTPLPYGVAPPEAQYGTIGLVVIISGATLYYIRGPKTTQQLFKENTAPRVRRRSSSTPEPKRAHTKRPGSRKVHTKKPNRRPVRFKK